MVGESHAAAFDQLDIGIARLPDVAGLVRVVSVPHRVKRIIDLFPAAVIKCEYHLHFFRGCHQYTSSK